MTGLELKNILKKKGVVMGDLARHLGISPASLTDRFNTEPKLSFIKEISEFTEIPVLQLIASVLPNTTGIVNEAGPDIDYSKPKKPANLQTELLDVYRENRKLHNKLLERDEYITQVLRAKEEK